MLCVNCQAPIPAQPEEVAWVCELCHQAQMFTEENGLKAIQVQYSASIPANTRGKPVWVATGQVTLQSRLTFKGDQSSTATAFWQTPYRFFIPAYNLGLEQIAEVGTRLLLQPPAIHPGTPTPFEPVTILPADLQALGEFIILSIEAGRKDDLKEVRFTLQLGDAELWVLP
jgi:hypothetical protein